MLAPVDNEAVVLAVLAAMLVSGLLYSSFLTHPRGIVDSLSAYRTYLQRAASGSWHIHPWNYYLSTLLYSHSSGGPVWTEGSIVGLAILGFAGAMSRNGVNGVDKTMLLFLAFYTVLMVVMYSLIPYKTPWCLLGFLHGLVLLAGAGAVRLMSLSRNAVVRSLILSLLAAATVHLGRQAWAASFRFDSDPRNPYVYAHTGKDVFVIAGRMESIARAVCPIV